MELFRITALSINPFLKIGLVDILNKKIILLHTRFIVYNRVGTIRIVTDYMMLAVIEIETGNVHIK